LWDRRVTKQRGEALESAVNFQKESDSAPARLSFVERFRPFLAFSHKPFHISRNFFLVKSNYST
jgi:hypothetical protein